MRPSQTIRRLMASALPMALLTGAALAQPLTSTGVNSYGLPGGVDTPSAEVLPDGTLGATLAWSDYNRRNSLVFQAAPRLTTGLRYSRIEGLSDRGYVWDRSFDLRYQMFEESGWRPAMAMGLQDFLGTGLFSGEYLVATKTVNPRLRISAGLGWGRLAGDSRQGTTDDLGGTPNVKLWFRGPARPFASAAWDANDRLRLVAEYSSDDYGLEVARGKDDLASQINLGATYKIGDAYSVSAHTIGGKSFGVQFSLALNPRDGAYPSGLEKAPAPVRPRPGPSVDPDGWSGAWAADPTAQPAIQKALGDALAKEGQMLESMALSAGRAEVRIRNGRYLQQAEAIGRTARLMTRALPPSVETLVITSSARGLPTSSVTLKRSDVERLENRAAAEIAQVATITSAPGNAPGLVATPELFPRLQWAVKPYVSALVFDPDQPFRYEIGGEAVVRYEVRPGLELAGAVRQRLFGTIEQGGPGDLTAEEYLASGQELNAFGVPRVRSDSRMYAGSDRPTIPQLTLNWYAKPTADVQTRVTFGLLEKAYAGVSAEALWKPADSPLGFGVEVNRVRKRDFDEPFGLRDYEVTTGHLSLYYDFGRGYLGQIDVGQYLAGDRGATVSVSREFTNGWRIGAFATKTDLSAEAFGEGSFDKGIRLSIPLGWATGQPTTARVTNELRSLNRDGGARLSVDGRLYDRVRDSHSGRLYDGWGSFWR